jgi:histidine triad (HIT) family protein
MNHVQVPVADPCAFCEYITGRRPYTVLDRGPLSAILVTREQRGVAHCLVVPLRHVPTILDLTTSEQCELMRDVVRVSAAIDAVEKRPGLTVWQNNGEPASQSIPHVHFHVAGTIEGGGTDWGAVSELSVEETDRIAERLLTALPQRGETATANDD